MVGYNENADQQLSDFWKGVAGTSSGVITRFISQPLDVLKIRFQLQHEPLKVSSENYYWNLKQASKRIVKEESYRALWKGHIPAQALSASYSLAQFSSFEILTKKAYETVGESQNRMMVHFCCGGISGAIATIVSMPFDTVRTRLVAQGEPKVYTGVFNAFLTMIKTEGVLALYKGLLPSIIQIMPNTAIQFAAFHMFSGMYHDFLSTDISIKLPVLGNLICGSGAGLVAKAAVYPFDLAKKRLQVQGFEEARYRFGKVQTYSGLLDCIRKTTSVEGFAGLYKGLVPSSVKAMVTSGLIFTLYEEISHLLLKFTL